MRDQAQAPDLRPQAEFSASDTVEFIVDGQEGIGTLRPIRRGRIGLDDGPCSNGAAAFSL